MKMEASMPLSPHAVCFAFSSYAMPSDHPSGHVIPQVEVEVVLNMTIPPSPDAPVPCPPGETQATNNKQFLAVPGASGDPALDESLRPRSSSAPTIKLIDAGARIAAGAAKAVVVAHNAKRPSSRSQNVNFLRVDQASHAASRQRHFKFRASCECVTEHSQGAGPGDGGRRRKSTFRRLSLAEHREQIEHHFCRINVLLVTMQLGLGGSMTVLDLFLQRLSPSMTVKECAFWATLPLLAAGILGLYFCSADRRLLTASLTTRLARTVCGSLSFYSSIACFVASVLSGHHGNFISTHNEPCLTAHGHHQSCCTNQRKNDSIWSAQRVSVLNVSACVCWTSGSPVYVYRNISCLYVYSALKDYLILQCALMAVACGVCAWFLVVLWQSRLRSHRPGLLNAPRHRPVNKKCHHCPAVVTTIGANTTSY